MPLETGTWTINQSGTATQLIIISVDATGNVSGTLNSVAMSGFWNEVLQKLTFISPIPLPLPPGFTPPPENVYTGFLFTDQFRMPGIRGGTVFTLAGYFSAFQSAVPSADRPTFGWYAQIGAA